MIGIITPTHNSIGDGLQFSSLPENYYRATGEKLLDLSRPWFFDFNPFVVRDDNAFPEKVIDLWNFGPKKYEWPRPHPAVYKSNAEIWAALFGVKPSLIRPRLYRYEETPFKERKTILLQTFGKSNGEMPREIIDHVIEKYKPLNHLYHIGFPDDPDIGIPKIPTPTLWELAKVISSAKMLIGPDSGPSWIAACYPDVIVKKVRLKLPDGEKPLDEWIPMEIDAFHSHWDDRAFQIYNPTDFDVGFTQSYRKL